MRCFTDADLRRGLEVVRDGAWNRCCLCGGENDDWHDALPHSFQPIDLLDVFLAAARDDRPPDPPVDARPTIR